MWTYDLWGDRNDNSGVLDRVPVNTPTQRILGGPALCTLGCIVRDYICKAGGISEVKGKQLNLNRFRRTQDPKPFQTATAFSHKLPQ